LGASKHRACLEPRPASGCDGEVLAASWITADPQRLTEG